ncbi:MAG: hypothetical protein FWJ70_09320 [Micromonosporaceae bacterium]|jgi:hypothetical protein
MRLTPVGPLPASVYWRRRAIVLAVALLVIFLVAQACMAVAGGGDERSSGNTPGPDASASDAPATPPSTPEPGGTAPAASGLDGGGAAPTTPPGDQCTDDEIEVTAQAERTEFAAGEPVRFDIVITHASDRECTRDLGGDQRELYLVEGSGATRVFSSRHCDPPRGTDVRTLSPGFTISFSYVSWYGNRSDVCRDGAPAGDLVAPGTYRLYARLGTAYSEPVVITIR